jgi:hypothetical protein
MTSIKLKNDSCAIPVRYRSSSEQDSSEIQSLDSSKMKDPVAFLNQYFEQVRHSLSGDAALLIFVKFDFNFVSSL